MPHIETDCVQGSPEWFALRAGIPTASEFGAILTPAFKAREGEGRNTYLCRKIAECVTGVPQEDFGGSFATEQGAILERQARGWFQLSYGCKIRQVAFVYADGNKAGCSPDGLIGDDEGIEIKCPQSPAHVKYLLADELPPAYRLQVHGSLYVTGRKRWHFLSYCRRFAPLHIIVERDEEIMGKIAAAISAFDADLKAGFAAIEAKLKTA